MTQASSSGSGPPGSGTGAGRSRRRRAISQLPPNDAGDPGLAEDQPGPLVGVVGVDRDVGGPDRQRGQDGDVQLAGAGGNADADPVAPARAGPVQHARPSPARPPAVRRS